MHFSTVATFLTLALSVAAIPQGPEIHQSKNRCDGGHISCCLEHSDIHADGTLSGVLTQGALTPLLGSKEQSCAKWELIENVNLLGMRTCYSSSI